MPSSALACAERTLIMGLYRWPMYSDHACRLPGLGPPPHFLPHKTESFRPMPPFLFSTIPLERLYLVKLKTARLDFSCQQFCSSAYSPRSPHSRGLRPVHATRCCFPSPASPRLLDLVRDLAPRRFGQNGPR